MTQWSTGFPTGIFNTPAVCAPNSEVSAHTAVVTTPHSWTQSRFLLKKNNTDFTSDVMLHHIRNSVSLSSAQRDRNFHSDEFLDISKLMVPPPCATLPSTPQGKSETTGRKTLQGQH